MALILPWNENLHQTRHGTAQKAPNCKGENKITHPNSSTEDHYFDSCRTSDILTHYDTCARWAGSVSLLALKWKPFAAVGPLLIAACGQTASPIKSAQGKSTLSAIIWRTTTYKPYQGGYQTVAEILPQ